MTHATKISFDDDDDDYALPKQCDCLRRAAPGGENPRTIAYAVQKRASLKIAWPNVPTSGHFWPSDDLFRGQKTGFRGAPRGPPDTKLPVTTGEMTKSFESIVWKKNTILSTVHYWNKLFSDTGVFILPDWVQIKFHQENGWKAQKWVKNQAKESKIHKIRTKWHHTCCGNPSILSSELLWESTYILEWIPTVGRRTELAWFLTHFGAFRWKLPFETCLSFEPIKTLNK